MGINVTLSLEDLKLHHRNFEIGEYSTSKFGVISFYKEGCNTEVDLYVHSLEEVRAIQKSLEDIKEWIKSE